ncbi:MAG: hypothetical protein Q8R15_02470 [Candidatus Micrarchaeota archaeon]|nr:hypothetical protein [Candidatus Micrarchaeota archaeon]
MIAIYAAKGCEKIAAAIAEGASVIETKITQNPVELTGDKNVVCLSKNLLGGETKPIEQYVNGKHVYIIGTGFSFEDMRLASDTLVKKGANVNNTLCLKRSSQFPFGGEVNETELVRTRAFGERIASTITGTRNFQENEKNRIKNYNK